MTREEAIKILKKEMEGLVLILEKPLDRNPSGTLEALDMAISALSEELSEDGTLTVHVSDGSKVKRVFVMGDNIFGGLYYPDSVENKGEWLDWKGNLLSKLDCKCCSNCNHVYPYVAFSYNFCPNCGAKMKGGE